MGDIRSIIIDINSSREYLLYKKYHEGNIFAITRTSRNELMHSAFIAWLFDSQLDHNLRDFPIKHFLGAIVNAKHKSENSESILSKETEKIIFETVALNKEVIKSASYVEVPISVSGKTRDRQIDIIVEVFISGKTLPIIIENKVNSQENRDQTVDYYLWAQNKYADNTAYHKPIFVYLKPSWSKSKPKQVAFIQFGYQDLVDYVLEPSISVCDDKRTIEYISMYLQCLSYQADNKKGGRIMALSSEERDILEQFYTKNKELFNAVFEMMLEDEDADPKTVEAAKKLLKGKDYSKYEFDGEIYNKRRLVLAVINKYVNDNTPQTYDDLVRAFPDGKIYKNLFKKALEASKGFRHYDEPVVVADGTIVWVNNQWGIDSISEFINNAEKKHGYVITKKN